MWSMYSISVRLLKVGRDNLLSKSGHTFAWQLAINTHTFLSAGRFSQLSLQSCFRSHWVSLKNFLCLTHFHELFNHVLFSESKFFAANLESQWTRFVAVFVVFLTLCLPWSRHQCRQIAWSPREAGYECLPSQWRCSPSETTYVAPRTKWRSRNLTRRVFSATEILPPRNARCILMWWGFEVAPVKEKDYYRTTK